MLFRSMNLKLTNDYSQSSSSNFISSYVKINDSTKKSLKEGYSTVTKSYDRIKKQFLALFSPLDALHLATILGQFQTGFHFKMSLIAYFQ